MLQLLKSLLNKSNGNPAGLEQMPPHHPSSMGPPRVYGNPMHSQNFGSQGVGRSGLFGQGGNRTKQFPGMNRMPERGNPMQGINLGGSGQSFGRHLPQQLSEAGRMGSAIQASGTAGVGTLEKIQKLIKMAESAKPFVEQYGPMLKNIPALITILKASGESDDTNEEPPKNLEKKKKSKKKLKTKNKSQKYKTESKQLAKKREGLPLDKRNGGESTPKMYV